MPKWIKITVCTALSLIFCFMTFGYAALTTDLNIGGAVSIEVPYGLFITSIETKSSSNVDHQSVGHLEYTTTVDALIDRRNSGAGTVTYTVTVLNNTELTYSYRDIYYQLDLEDYNGNGTYEEGRWNNKKTYQYINNTGSNSKRIGVETNFPNGTMVAPHESLEFEVTYTIGTGMDASTDWRTLINFQFGINVDGEDEAITIVEEKFLNILNTDSTYIQLVDALDNKFDGREWTSNYIGNVNGSSSADSVAVNTLFAGQLQITVGDEEMDATVMIKHENLDGNRNTGDDYTAVNGNQSFTGYGCEMTLYLTIDPLAKEDMGEYVPVYAVVFTCDRDAEGNIVGDWYRIGDTYEGEADVVDYDGGTDGDGGSFVTDRWRSKYMTYEVIDGYNYTVDGVNYSLGAYSYGVGYRVGIKSIVTGTEANATNTMQTLLNHAKAIIDNKDYAGTGIVEVEEAYAATERYYTVDANGNPVVDAEMTRAQLIPAIKRLYTAIDKALLQMEALSNERN